MDYLIVFRRDGFRFEKLIMADNQYQALWHAEHLACDEPAIYTHDFDLYELWYDTRGGLHLGAIDMEKMRADLYKLQEEWVEWSYGY